MITYGKGYLRRNIMIDIEGLTEAQVRYILKELLEMGGNNLLEGDILWIKGNSDYPQNNEESVDE